jgi:RNA polymerase sigma factor (sigma-70 family)
VVVIKVPPHAWSGAWRRFDLAQSAGLASRMPDDTAIGGVADRFPTTRVSAISGSSSEDPSERARSFEVLVAAYWKPVYKYIRLRWGKSSEDAKDLTQGFFLRAMEKGLFNGYDPARARFRTYLRVCLDGYLTNEEKASRRLKRGGGVDPLPLDFETAEGELKALEIASPETIERSFDAEWVRSLFDLALETLRAECVRRGKETALRLFERYDLEDAGAGRQTYEDLATEFGLPVTQVTNHLAFARREFRRVLLEKLREITSGDEEFRREARDLLGTDPG